jgi:hypothetical protein
VRPARSTLHLGAFTRGHNQLWHSVIFVFHCRNDGEYVVEFHRQGPCIFYWGDDGKALPATLYGRIGTGTGGLGRLVVEDEDQLDLVCG